MVLHSCCSFDGLDCLHVFDCFYGLNDFDDCYVFGRMCLGLQFVQVFAGVGAAYIGVFLSKAICGGSLGWILRLMNDVV